MSIPPSEGVSFPVWQPPATRLSNLHERVGMLAVPTDDLAKRLMLERSVVIGVREASQNIFYTGDYDKTVLRAQTPYPDTGNTLTNCTDNTTMQLGIARAAGLTAFARFGNEPNEAHASTIIALPDRFWTVGVRSSGDCRSDQPARGGQVHPKDIVTTQAIKGIGEEGGAYIWKDSNGEWLQKTFTETHSVRAASPVRDGAQTDAFVVMAPKTAQTVLPSVDVLADLARYSPVQYMAARPVLSRFVPLLTPKSSRKPGHF